MKYDKKQFEVLVKVVKIFSQHFAVTEINKHGLHYMVYQQFSEGQTHNSIYIEGNELKRQHSVKNMGETKKLIDFDYDFQLYPKGCDDTHIETAMKNALKQI